MSIKAISRKTSWKMEDHIRFYFINMNATTFTPFTTILNIFSALNTYNTNFDEDGFFEFTLPDGIDFDIVVYTVYIVVYA